MFTCMHYIVLVIESINVLVYMHVIVYMQMQTYMDCIRTCMHSGYSNIVPTYRVNPTAEQIGDE